MQNDEFPGSRILTVNQFVNAFQAGMKNNERFCFILGSGASVESGIPMGGTLENNWMACLMGEKADTDGTAPCNPEETRRLAASLRAEGKLQYDFKDIEENWEKIKQDGKGTLSSKYYFDLYKIRFFPNHRNGYFYLEKLMADKEPSFGYHPLAQLLTDGRGNNLVITTNFDSLIEDALFLYTRSKPLVINHELLADYIGNHNVKRPIIAKIHRGMFFDPLNDPQDTTGLKGKWHEVLEYAFQIYTPVVLGYGGGDHSLMDFLLEEQTQMLNGIYWCYMEQYGLPDLNVQELVLKHNGCFVKMLGFDSFMLTIGNRLYPDKISAHETERYLSTRNTERIERYYKTVEALSTQKIVDGESVSSEHDYTREVEKFTRREEEGQRKREDTEQMTAWDYNRKANLHYDRKEFKKAVYYYTEAIKIQPENAVFYNNRGISYAELGENEKAIADYTKAIELDAEYELPYNNRGIRYAELGEYDKAIENYNRAIELDAEYAAAYNNRGNTYSDMEEYDKAIEDYNRAIELNPKFADAYYNRGNTYSDIEEYDKAIEDYNRVIELDAEYAAVYNNRGNRYAFMKEYDKAIEDYNKAIEINSEYVIAYSNRGESYAAVKEYDKAIADFTKAIELDSEYRDAYEGRAEVLRALGREKEADSDEEKVKILTK